MAGAVELASYAAVSHMSSCNYYTPDNTCELSALEISAANTMLQDWLDSEGTDADNAVAVAAIAARVLRVVIQQQTRSSADVWFFFTPGAKALKAGGEP